LKKDIEHMSAAELFRRHAISSEHATLLICRITLAIEAGPCPDLPTANQHSRGAPL